MVFMHAMFFNCSQLKKLSNCSTQLQLLHFLTSVSKKKSCNVKLSYTYLEC